MADFDDFKKALKPLEAKAADCFSKVDSLNKNISHHKQMMAQYGRGLGEAMQDLRNGKGKPKDVEMIQKSAKSSLAVLKESESDMASLKKTATTLRPQLEQLDKLAELFVKTNAKHKDAGAVGKFRTALQKLIGNLNTEVIVGTESVDMAKIIKYYDADVSEYMKMSRDVGAKAAADKELRDRLPMLFNDRHVVVRKATMDDSVKKAKAEMDEAAEALAASKKGLLSNPPIIAVASIDRNVKAAEKILGTIKEIFLEYGKAMADLAKHKEQNKIHLASKEGKLATSILKTGHEAQEAIKTRLQGLRKSEASLIVLAKKMAEIDTVMKARRG